MPTKILSIFRLPHTQLIISKSLKALLLDMLLIVSMGIILSGGLLNLIQTTPTQMTIIIHIIATTIAVPSYLLSRTGRYNQTISIVVLITSWILATWINIYYEQVAISAYMWLTLMTILLINIESGIIAGMTNMFVIMCLYLFRDSLPISLQAESDIFFIVINISSVFIILGIAYFVIGEITKNQKLYQKNLRQIKDDAKQQHDRIMMEYHTVLDVLSEAVIITDMQLNIMTWNSASAHIYGYSPQEAIGKKLTDMIPTAFSSNDNQTTLRQRHTGLWRNEIIQKRADNGYVHALSTMSLLYDTDNRPVGAITINQEITDYVHLERRIEALDKEVLSLEQLRNDIMMLIGDDVRKQVNDLRTQNQILKYKLDNPAITSQFDQITQSLDKLINTLLLVNNIHKELKNSRGERIDMKPLVEESVRIHTPLAKQRNVKMTFIIEGDDSELIVEADKSLLIKAINHYLNNSITFTPEGGGIVVKLSASNQVVSYTVSDTGEGIPKNRWQDVFEPYFNHRHHYIDDTISGLSLYMIKTFVIKYNGTLIFESSYGKGSLFGLALPHIVAPVL